jgi:hypothetical protein
LNKFVFFMLLAAAFYLAYEYYYQDDKLNTGGYNLSALEEKPIPTKYFFTILHEKALKECVDTRQHFNLSYSECLDKINSNRSACEKSSLSDSIDTIDNKRIAKQITSEFLQCIIPGYHCNGIEVKTEEQARKYCNR